MTAELAQQCLISTATEWGSSRFKEYYRCPRGHALHYRDGISIRVSEDLEMDPEGPDTPDNLEVGSLCHAVLAYAGICVMRDEPADWWDLVLEAASTPDGDRAAFQRGSIDEARRLMTHYWFKWGLDNAGYPAGSTVLAVEQLFESAPGALGPTPHTGRADAIIRLASGEVVIVDHKTRRAAFPADRDRYIRGCSTNPQFTALSWFARHVRASASLSASCDALMLDRYVPLWVNGIIKTKTPKFDRLLVRFTDDGVQRWAAWHSLNASIMAENDTPNPAACAPEGQRRCWAFQWCHGTEAERARVYTTLEKSP